MDSSAAQAGSFSHFKAKCVQARIQIAKGVRSPANPLVDVECSYDLPFHNDARLKLHYDQELPRYIGSQPYINGNYPRFDNPYAQVPWDQRSYLINHAGLTLNHDQATLLRTGDGV